jgi:cytochrome c oxidase subunit 2
MIRKSVLGLFLLFFLLEGISLSVFFQSKEKGNEYPNGAERLVEESRSLAESFHEKGNTETDNEGTRETSDQNGLAESVSRTSLAESANSDDSSLREFGVVVSQWKWEPSVIKVRQGERVRLNIESIDVLHGLVIPELDVYNYDLPAGKTTTLEFVATKKGRFEFLCSVFCGDRHIEMTGVIIVE